MYMGGQLGARCSWIGGVCRAKQLDMLIISSLFS